MRAQSGLFTVLVGAVLLSFFAGCSTPAPLAPAPEVFLEKTVHVLPGTAAQLSFDVPRLVWLVTHVEASAGTLRVCFMGEEKDSFACRDGVSALDTRTAVPFGAYTLRLDCEGQAPCAASVRVGGEPFDDRVYGALAVATSTDSPTTCSGRDALAIKVRLTNLANQTIGPLTLRAESGDRVATLRTEPLERSGSRSVGLTLFMPNRCNLSDKFGIGLSITGDGVQPVSDSFFVEM